MKIILAGGGEPSVVEPIDKYYLSAIDISKPVLYIPVAMEATTFSYEECSNWFKSTYEPMGISKIDVCIDLSTADFSKDYSSVFIGGGNTFKLLRKMRETGFDKRLKLYLQNGGTAYGGSAGAIIFGSSIECAGYLDNNYMELKDLSGLNMLNGYDVFCHYNPPEDDSYINSYKNDLYILYEESGIIFDGHNITSVGKPYIIKK